MKGPLGSFASLILRSTTASDGNSALPDWAVAPLALLAGEDTAVRSAQDKAWANEKLVRKAVALYRAAGTRSGGEAAVKWQFSSDGSQAVQVLPAPVDRYQQQALAEISRRLESVTMNHPRLAPILESAVQQGYPYLAARIGQGFQSLTRRFGLPMEPARAMQIAEQAISALEYAHYRGVIHGSFDLGDILVNERGQISVLGVGVDQLRQRLGSGSSVLLSPLLPPEVESGAQQADVRTDVYAMGALLYVLLTGRIPAAGQQIQLAQSLPDVPAALDAVLTKALAEQPEERYASLGEMSRDLRVAMRTPRAPARPATVHVSRIDAHAARRSALTTPDAVAAPPPMRAPAVRPDGFPEQLPMPEIDFSALEQALEMPQIEAWVQIDIPPAPEIPEVNWAEMLQPLDLTDLAGETISLPYEAAETLAPDPLVAAIMAVEATEESQHNRQRSNRSSADAARAAAAGTPAARRTQSPAKPRRARRK